MKRICVVIVAISLLFLFGCQNKPVPVEQSEKNFAAYQVAFNEIVAKYGYDIKEIYDENITPPKSYKDLLITINENEKIYIRMINSAYSSNWGLESFALVYSIKNSKSETKSFNTKLFVELANEISEKAITKGFCDEFLKAPESKYPASKYGFEKLNGELIAKETALNFFEDWSISYILNADGEGVLTFGGLVK